MNVDVDTAPFLQTLALIASTFASEDMTCVASGILARVGKLHPATAMIGCFLGVYLGDIGLWLIGRFMGRRVLEWNWCARKLPRARIDSFGHWFDRHGWRAVLASRFMPGTRVPVYVAAGIVGNRPLAFMMWTFMAVAIWTPLIVGLSALLGPVVMEPMTRFFNGGWVAIVAAVILLFAVTRLAVLTCTDLGRAKLVAKVSRLWRWEFWPTWLFYIPVYPWIAWLALRYRGLSIPTAANPGIPQGGIVGESKAEILAKLPLEWVLPFTRLESGESDGRMALLARFMAQSKSCFPVILKPDSGERGASVRLVRDESSARAYFEQTSGPVLAQAYHPGPYEAGIFYYRMPDEPKGNIFSITDKQFSYLCGDGVHSVEQLIWKHPRFRMQAHTFLKRHAASADRTLKSGELLRLAEAGNHCQGTLFKDGSGLITPVLADAIDAIAREFDGFYFGRFDVRYADADLLRNGGGFQIIELNGVTSESTNIYDPSWTMLQAYKTLFRQWSILFEIGAANRARGIRSTSLLQVLSHISTNYRLRRLDPLAD